MALDHTQVERVSRFVGLLTASMNGTGCRLISRPDTTAIYVMVDGYRVGELDVSETPTVGSPDEDGSSVVCRLETMW